MQAAVAGFRNEGHTCGASAALALLLSSPRVLDIVLRQSGTKGSVLEALHNIAVDAWQFGVGGRGEDHVVKTTRPLRALVGPPRDLQRFVDGSMFNSLDFVQAVLGQVPQLWELCRIDATTVTTCECGHSTRRPETDTSLFLPASSASNPLNFAAQLEASLCCKPRPEVVREARCGGCMTEGRMASGRFEVIAAGEVLVLSVVSGDADVVPSPLDPPQSIQVLGRPFKLRSVVVHRETPSLHFTARSVALDETCRAHDDASVTVTGGVGGAEHRMTRSGSHAEQRLAEATLTLLSTSSPSPSPSPHPNPHPHNRLAEAGLRGTPPRECRPHHRRRAAQRLLCAARAAGRAPAAHGRAASRRRRPSRDCRASERTPCVAGLRRMDSRGPPQPEAGGAISSGFARRHQSVAQRLGDMRAPQLGLAGKVGDGDGISCSDCPPNAAPSAVPLACRCQEGHYNSSFGLVQCKPSPMPAPQNGFVCQPCGACLDCEASLSTFARALVQPGYKLGVAATRTYRGVERGNLHVNKVFHKCSHGASARLPRTTSASFRYL